MSGFPNPQVFVPVSFAGSPSSGSWSKGQAIIDSNGASWVCITSGAPGTWAQLAASAGDVLSVFGRTGTVVATTGDYTAAQVTNAADKASASQQTFTAGVAAFLLDADATGTHARLIGGTSGAPASGTWNLGDVAIDTAGIAWICTVAGTPGTWSQLAATTSPGALLATQVYAPASLTTYTLTATLATIDTTNATLAFTVPASGKVQVEVQIYCNCTSDATHAPVAAIGLLNHSGGAQIGTNATLLASDILSTGNIEQICRVVFNLTGLSPGALQVDLAGVASGLGGTATAKLFARGVTGNTVSTAPLVMRAFAA